MSSSDSDLFPDLDYTSRIGGNSAATALVSGILALTKEAQPNLNTRLAKHLLARTSRLIDVGDATPMGGWTTNGAGLHFNNNYGFGLIDADALTLAATEYSGVTPMSQQNTGTIVVGSIIPDNSDLGVSHTFSVDSEGPLEEVEVDLNVMLSSGSNYSLFARGDIEATLTSPSGTSSLLMYRNGLDRGGGPLDWTFLSNAFWGEDPTGNWILTLRDVDAGRDDIQDRAVSLWHSFEVNLRSGSLIPSVAVPEPSTATSSIIMIVAVCQFMRRARWFRH